MEIKQLRTLEQHIDYVKSLAPKDFCKLINEDIHDFTDLETDALKFHQVCKYTKHQKQPLTEEMVFNKIKEPDKKDYRYGARHLSFNNKSYYRDLEAWQKAESKVIFEEWKHYDNSKNNNSILSYVKKDNYVIHFHDTGEVYLYVDSLENRHKIKSLHDIAEKTNGELKTKNLTI